MSKDRKSIGIVVQNFAIICLPFNILAAILCALGFSSTHYGIDIEKFVLILFGGLVASGIIFIFVHAFGCLVESSIITAANSIKILKAIEEKQQEKEPSQQE